jgi:hypothetical protein
VDVTWEESLRKNRKRFNPEKPGSILKHSLSDAKMEFLYKQTGWSELSRADPQALTIQGLRVVYVVFDNSDDLTSREGMPWGTGSKGRCRSCGVCTSIAPRDLYQINQAGSAKLPEMRDNLIGSLFNFTVDLQSGCMFTAQLQTAAYFQERVKQNVRHLLQKMRYSCPANRAVL